MASAESLKVRASRPKSEGISAAETMVDLERSIDSPEYDYGTVWQDGLVNLPSNIAGLFSAQRQQVLRPESKSVVETPTGGFFEVTNPAVYGPVERGPGIESPAMRGLGFLSRLMAGDPATERQTAETVGRGLSALPQGVTQMVRDLPRTAEGMLQTATSGVPTVAYDYDEQGRPIEGTGAPPVLDPFLVMGMGAPQMIAAKLGKIPEGSLGIFGGRYAENVTDKMHKEYNEARLMLDTGSSVEEVYNATRKVAMRREDIDPNSPEFYNQPRSEQYLISHHIPDNEMTVNKKGLNSLIENSKLSPGMPQKLENVMNHESLYEAYPWLRDVKIAIYSGDEMGRSIATWNEGENLIKLNARFLKGDPEQVLSYILHEASHAIQGKESFVAGRSWQQTLKEKGSIGGDNPQFAKGSNQDFEYSKIAASRPNKNLPSTLNDAMNKIAGLRSQIETDVYKLDFKIDEKILGEAEAFGNKSPSWVSHNLHRYQRHELARKLDKQGQEAFLNMYSGIHAPMNAAEAKLFESRMAEFRRLGDSEQVQKFMDLKSKVRENVELSEVVEKSERNYLINAGELQARLTQAMRKVGADDPDNPQFRFNEALKEIKHEAEFLSTPSSLTQDYFKKAGSDDPTGGLFSAQHMDSMADAVSPKTASGHKINTSFGLGKMKTPKDMNKGGYVMTGAETMMGLD